MSGILDQTTNLRAVYLWHAGNSEVPSLFHEWAFYTLVAACVQDRVFVRKFSHARLVPNLYTFLVGPPGLGKGEAVDLCLSYATRLPIDTFNGMITAQALLEQLGAPKASGRVFLVTEELGMSVGDGPAARDFVKHMTGLYKGADYPLVKRTVTGANAKISNYRICWLAGTTIAWLIESVPRSAIEGGFLGRAIIVRGHYDLNLRLTRPEYPADWNDCQLLLYDRLLELTTLAGEFEVDDEARAIEHEWYTKRPAPTEENLVPSWKREHDQVLKLAMILALCDSPHLVIQASHMIRAQQTVGAAMRAVPEILSAAAVTRETEASTIIEQAIRRAGTIDHSQLLRRVSSRGIDANRLRNSIQDLYEKRRIRIVAIRGAGRRYVWQHRQVQELPTTDPTDTTTPDEEERTPQ